MIRKLNALFENSFFNLFIVISFFIIVLYCRYNLEKYLGGCLVFYLILLMNMFLIRIYHVMEKELKIVNITILFLIIINILNATVLEHAVSLKVYTAVLLLLQLFMIVALKYIAFGNLKQSNSSNKQYLLNYAWIININLNLSIVYNIAISVILWSSRQIYYESKFYIVHLLIVFSFLILFMLSLYCRLTVWGDEKIKIVLEKSDSTLSKDSVIKYCSTIFAIILFGTVFEYFARGNWYIWVETIIFLILVLAFIFKMGLLGKDAYDENKVIPPEKMLIRPIRTLGLFLLHAVIMYIFFLIVVSDWPFSLKILL